MTRPPKIKVESVVEPNNIQPGLYRVFWKGGGCSLASVGATKDGGRWLAPINWIAPTIEQRQWKFVERLEAIEAEIGQLSPRPATPATESMLLEALGRIKRGVDMAESNRPVIVAGLELNPDVRGAYSAAEEGIRNWADCGAVDSLIVSVEPRNVELLEALRTFCQAAGIGFVPGLKLSPLFPTVKGDDGKTYNAFDDLEAWTKVADTIVGACHHAGSSVIYVDAESAMKGYARGLVGIKAANLAAGLRLLPPGINVLWYPSITDGAPEGHARQYAAMETLLMSHGRVTFVNQSIAQTCDYYGTGAKKNLAALRELYKRFYAKPRPLLHKIYGYGRPKYWDLTEIPSVIGMIPANDSALITTGAGLWVEGSRTIGGLLNLANSEKV